MTAAEIRAMTLGETKASHMLFICAMLQEIAAKLAEHVDYQADIFGELQGIRRGA